MSSIVNLTFHLESSIIGAPTEEDVRRNPDFTEHTMLFDEYVGKLVTEIVGNARNRFDEVPQLDISINAPAVEIAWIEMMKAHIYDMVPSTLANATTLVEVAMKERVTRAIPRRSPEEVEKMGFYDSFTELKKHITLTKRERQELADFNDFERNTFIHQKTLTLLKTKHPEMVSVKQISLTSGEETNEEVPLESARVLWPVLKRRVERGLVLDTMKKAVRLTNRIMGI